MAIPAKSVKRLFDLAGNFHIAFVAVHAEVLPGIVNKIVVAENAIYIRMILVVESHWQHGRICNLALTKIPQQCQHRHGQDDKSEAAHASAC